MNLTVAFELNGEPVTAEVRPSTRLVDVLRDVFGNTGTKIGCEEGECGACTVVVDDKPVNSCLYLAADVDGRNVVTIEGSGEEGRLDDIKRVFVEHGAVQCGFCTPGMIMCTYAFLRDFDAPTEDDMRRSIEGNICRCTGYIKIIDAIRELRDARRPTPVGGGGR